MLYPQLLEHDFGRLPEVLRQFHSTPGGGRASGEIDVRHENSLLAWLIGFPKRGEHIPTQLTVQATEDCEVWVRRIGDCVRKSRQRRKGGLLMEQLGPLRVVFQVFANETGMRFETKHATLWGIPVPVSVSADVRGGECCWRLSVSVKHIGSYEGVMAPLR